uniref:Pyrin domain-containing protein n=1 Tax=Amphiprion percula TaxID=161767 RepID=A0A3P8RZ99_AMPPE
VENSYRTLRPMDATQQLIQVLDHLRSEDLKAFQHLLTLQSDPIPVCRLEAADRTGTVDLMVQKYHAEGAMQVTEEILRQLNYNQLKHKGKQQNKRTKLSVTAARETEFKLSTESTQCPTAASF